MRASGAGVLYVDFFGQKSEICEFSLFFRGGLRTRFFLEHLESFDDTSTVSVGRHPSYVLQLAGPAYVSAYLAYYPLDSAGAEVRLRLKERERSATGFTLSGMATTVV